MNGMMRFLRTQRKRDIFFLLVGTGCLLATALQYPLATTFPIGGDAAAHISNVQHLFSKPLETMGHIARSWYPVTYVLFSMLNFVPLSSWPELYTWWMALGQIMIGLTLGLLAYRLSGLRAAAAAIGLWAITPITMTSFFEDGTMAQLWSLPWIILFFARIAQKSLRDILIFAALAVLSHPITSFMLLATMIFTTVSLWMKQQPLKYEEEKIRKVFAWITIASIALASYALITRWEVLLLRDKESSKYMPELLRGFFFPWLLVSIVGLISFIKQHKKNIILVTGLGCFFFLSLLLAANTLGVSFWTNRVNAYLLLCVTLGAAIGVSELLTNLKPFFLTAFIAPCIIIGLTASVIHTNANIYQRNESLSVYIRIHPEELAAIEWIKNTTPLHTIVFTSDSTRHYEWIPVLSNRKWTAISIEEIQNPEYQSLENEKYLVFFTRKEKAPDAIRNDSSKYSLVYETSGAEIFYLIPTL